MVKDIEIFLRDLMSSWQVARMYTVEHPKFTTALSRAYESLKNILGRQSELVIGILEQELVSGNDIFFELSKITKIAITYLLERGIERIVFYKDIRREELIKFIDFLLTPKEEIKIIPQEYLAGLDIKNIEVSKFKKSAANVDDGINETEIQFMHYENCLSRASQSFETFINQGAVDYLNLRFISNNIMVNLVENYKLSFKITQLKNPDNADFIHCLNVAVLSMNFSKKMGFDRDSCLAIGIAALFHDFGKLYIAKKVVQKNGKISREELLKIKSHSAIGAAMLLEHMSALTILPVVVAFEHHLRYDLKGVNAFHPRKPHIASMIVSICDNYDAIAQRRTHERDYPPEMIYNIMIKGKGKRFSPELLDRFFAIMGVWPKGTVVLLEDGRAAIVREEDEDDIFSPQIEIISDALKALVDLKKVKDIRIKRSLNPLGEGREYCDLI